MNENSSRSLQDFLTILNVDLEFPRKIFFLEFCFNSIFSNFIFMFHFKAQGMPYCCESNQKFFHTVEQQHEITQDR